MSVCIKQEHSEHFESQVQQKKEKVGRWTKAECYLFECLLIKFGKNWKKIHERMSRRTLSQIRSHAQKYFEKIGSAKVEEYEHRAKLFEAMETLEKEKQITENVSRPREQIENKCDQVVKQEEQSPMTGSQSGSPILETIIKEQSQNENKQSQERIKIPEAKVQTSQVRKEYCFPETYHAEGYLVTLFHQYPELFVRCQSNPSFPFNMGNWLI